MAAATTVIRDARMIVVNTIGVDTYAGASQRDIYLRRVRAAYGSRIVQQAISLRQEIARSLRAECRLAAFSSMVDNRKEQSGSRGRLSL
jgi:hypothetical protein